uniref:Hylin-a1 n=1 Tax=Boana albopunctata TaxID=279985 RepID=ALBO1_BOAAL|nr:RecName: Full=Hylin-a1; Short=Hy-a1 [Boana albopunctata]
IFGAILPLALGALKNLIK